MNTRNASGFALMGFAMWLLPSMAPGLFPANGLDGSSARAMWMTFMGVVQMALGLGFLLQQSGLPWLARWLAEEPAQPLPALPTTFGARALAFEAAAAANGNHLLHEELELDGVVTLRGKHAALWRTLKEAFLDEKRFGNFLERFRLLAQSHRDRAHINGTPHVVLSDDAEHALVHLIATNGINLDLLERRSRDWFGRVTAASFLREAADEVSQVVSNSRRAA